MFSDAGELTLEMAQAAATFLYRRRRLLELDKQTTARLNTLYTDIAAELEDREAARAQAAAGPAEPAEEE